MMEFTNGDENVEENIPQNEDENPFQDSKLVEEDVEIHVDENTAAEAARKEEIRRQMAKLQEEITTLRSALERKERQFAELKRELGITAWSQLKDGIGSQISYIQNSGVVKKTSETLKGWNERVVHSDAYTKTYSALSGAGEATTSAIKSAGAVTAKKIGEIRGSETFKTIEHKVSSATSTIKGKVVGTNPGEVPTEAGGAGVEMEEAGLDEVDPSLDT